MVLSVSETEWCRGTWTGMRSDLHTQLPLSEVCDISLSTAYCLQGFEMVNSITNHQG